MTGIHQRIAAVMKDLRGVEKTGRHQQGYAYAGHEAVATAIRPLFVEHGIVQEIDCGDVTLLDGGHVKVNVRVRWTNRDNGQDFVEGSVPALQQCQSKAGNPTAQQVGQAISYAVKNFQLKTLMLLDSNEPEGESLPHESPRVVNLQAETWLKALEAAGTLDLVKMISEQAKEGWVAVRDVPGYTDAFAKARAEAIKRIRASGVNT